MTYKGVTGQRYTLIQKIAGGGEGDVFSVQGDGSILAKVYHPNVSITSHQEKILSMVRAGQGHTFQYIAWPRDALFNEQSQFCGFIMKKFNGVKSLAELLPEPDLSWKKRVAVAYNLCDVVREIHGMNQCIGDMNPSNFGIDPARGNIFAFDADSFHFRDEHNHFYPCVVGLPEYYAPELQRQLKRGQDMRTINPAGTFNCETDQFALAVLIFQLLFAGYHPFSGRRLKNYGSSTVVHKQSTNILNKVSPFFNPPAGISSPMHAPPVEIVPLEMQNMFRQAFLTERRPNAMEWQRALFRLLNSLTTCVKVHDHYYYNKLSKCPWCAETPQRTTSSPPPPPPPPVTKPVVTMNPEKRRITEGQGVEMQASASGQGLTARWFFMSPDNQVIPWDQLADFIPGVSVCFGDSSRMRLRNIPVSLNGWRAFCSYSNSAGVANSNPAGIEVIKSYKPSRRSSAGSANVAAKANNSGGISTGKEPNEIMLIILGIVLSCLLNPFGIAGLVEAIRASRQTDTGVRIKRLISARNWIIAGIISTLLLIVIALL